MEDIKENPDKLTEAIEILFNNDTEKIDQFYDLAHQFIDCLHDIKTINVYTEVDENGVVTTEIHVDELNQDDLPEDIKKCAEIFDQIQELIDPGSTGR